MASLDTEQEAENTCGSSLPLPTLILPNVDPAISFHIGRLVGKLGNPEKREASFKKVKMWPKIKVKIVSSHQNNVCPLYR